ncbi:proline racemase family protein [Aliikangiella sp. IMCC44359]|uniref:proline racemase family protein n=1 Tax=Aliikangiella sp. IMCC44359 TaxID=3459125 RepID=UPI00403A89B9
MIKQQLIAKSLSIDIEKSQGFLSLLRRLAQCIAALWTSQTTKRAAKITAFIVSIDSDLAILLSKSEKQMSSFIERFTEKKIYPANDKCLQIKTIDMHTGGEPLRIIVDGYPNIQADSILDYRQKLKAGFDHLRTALMFEPRGHADMYGCLILPPFHPDADCSAIFMHNEGYSNMCGHAVIAIMTLSMEMGWVDIINDQAQLNIEAPCGLIKATGTVINGKIKASFECVPSFVKGLDQTVYLSQVGKTIQYDLAFGGAFYAYVDIEQFELKLIPENSSRLIELGKEIKHAVAQQTTLLEHPYETELNELYGVIFISPALSEKADSRNVCIFADGELDRSPTGSGVSGRMAIHYARKEIALEEVMLIESILGSCFSIQVVKEIQYANSSAVIPLVTGDAYICGMNHFIINPDDALNKGFLVR